MFTLKSEPQDKQAIIAQGINFYKQSFWLALPYSFLAVLFIFMPLLVVDIPQLFADLHPPLTLSRLVQNIPLIWGTWLTAISWIMGFVILSALIFRLYGVPYNIPLTFWGSLSHALFKLIPLLLLGILYALMVISGTIFLIIPGIILSISLMFSFILFITDNQNVLQTLLTSHRLVWGHWWHTLVVMSFPLLLNIAVSLLALLLLGAYFAYGNAELNLLFWISCFINIIIQTLFIPFIICVALVLLNDLRARQTIPLPRW